MIKKADIFLFIFLVAFGLVISCSSLSDGSSGDEVVLTVGGELYGVYALDEDNEIDIVQQGCSNHITIKGGMVSMTSSTCQNQVCVETGAISHAKDSIACLPNKVIVEIRSNKAENEQGGEIDVISG